MLLKISNKKIILLIVLLGLMLLGGYSKFIFIPQMNKIKQLNMKKEKYEIEIKEEKNNKVLNKKLEGEIKNLNEKIKKSVEKIFPDIEQEKFIVVLDNMILKSGIKSNSISFSTVSIEKVLEKEAKDEKQSMLETLMKEYKNLIGQKQGDTKVENEEEKKDAANNGKDTKEIVPEAEKMSITIVYTGTYKSVMNFIDQVKAFDKRIIIKDISFGTSSAENNKKDENDEINDIINNYTVNIIDNNSNEEVSGNIVLEFYAVPKFSEEDSNYLKWEFKDDYGKLNPFKK